MKVAYSWLQSRLDLTMSAQEVAELLTSMGLEVEHIEGYAPVINHVVVARIQRVEPHPSADRLRVAQVFDGEQTWNVVCGAPNCREGITVALAKIGACLPGGFEIKKTKIRGVESYGMLCALDELGYAGQYDGIYELDQSCKLGSLAMEYINDPVLILGLTPDLGHCLSINGIARLISAKLDIPLKLPSARSLNPSFSLKTPKVQIETDQCWQYACMSFNSIEVGPSPQWLVKSLEKAGYRSVNNWVDAGNWIMLETGRPIHLFDLDTLSGDLIVRLSHAQEKMERIDGITQELEPGLLVISDQKGPVALAGAMGSKQHEVSHSTKRALLEVALFDPRSVRRSVKCCQCHSESSRRFERGVPLDNAQSVFERFIALLESLGGHFTYSDIHWAGTKHFVKKEIKLQARRVKDLLGIEVSPQQCQNLLTRLGLSVRLEREDLFCQIPLDRHDLAIEEDLIDEIMKLIGTDNLPRSNCRARLPGVQHDPMYSFTRSLRSKLVGMGLQEVITLDFVNSQKMQGWGLDPKQLIKLQNPSSCEADSLRPNLLASMVETLLQNQAQQIHNLAIFEIGSVYSADSEPQETSALGILLHGSYEHLRWDESGKDFDFYDLKGILETLFESLSIEVGACCSPSDIESIHNARSCHPWLHPKQQAIWLDTQGVVLGHLGNLHPKFLSNLGQDKAVYYAELSLKDLLQAQRKVCQYRALPMYPSSSRDWTITVPESIDYGRLLEAVPHVACLVGIELVGIWRSEKLGSDRKNVTLRLHYRSEEKTLTQQEVEAQHATVQASVMRELSLQHLATGGSAT